MSKVKIQGNASGTGVLTVTAPNTSTDRVITLPDEDVTLGAATPSIDDNGNATAITIDSSENVLVGKTTSDTGNSLGFEARQNGLVNIGRDGGEPLLLNRNTSEGDIVAFRKDGTTKGSIGVTSSGAYITLGGTGAANTLDDYEEGTWSPTITCTTSGSYTLQGAADLAAYTKIGRVVTVQGGLSVNGESSPNGNLRITLPFTAFQSTDDTDFSMGNLALGNHGSTLDVAGLNAFVMEGNYFFIWGVNPDGTTRYINHNDVDTSWQVYFNFTYIAA
jgi:hypothetical protein